MRLVAIVNGVAEMGIERGFIEIRVAGVACDESLVAMEVGRVAMEVGRVARQVGRVAMEVACIVM